eukprot:TRINITY_DN27432_c0_g1_i1.p1 TRINITY_DN27432_c0_g1~~TRINITY_DN27432_c0_g1_i1.p1  ORF type:complete len:499 (-),score=61.74 TRINITY_DN27432_c0_g1_i1:274-1734(-)
MDLESASPATPLLPVVRSNPFKKLAFRACLAFLFCAACTVGIVGWLRPEWLSPSPSRPPPPPQDHMYMGQPCDILAGTNCNPYQIPGATSSWSPTVALVQGKVVRTNLSRLVQSYGGGFAEQISQMSATVASSFGIGLDAKAFSASFDLRNVFKSSFDSKRTTFQFRNFVQYDLFSLRFDSLQATDDLQQVWPGLPTDPTTDLTPWFDFYGRVGTHFTETVTFGGKLQQSGAVQTEITQDSSFSQQRMAACATTILARFLGLSGHWVTEQDSAVLTKFQQFASFGSVEVIGGKPRTNLTDIDGWIASVETNPVPISSTLAPIQQLIPESHQQAASSALEQYRELCPSNDKGVCSGVGWCNWQLKTCTCPPDRTGDECQYFTCRDMSNNNLCDPNARCDRTTGKCVCPSVCQNGGTCGGTGKCDCPQTDRRSGQALPARALVVSGTLSDSTIPKSLSKTVGGRSTNAINPIHKRTAAPKRNALAISC